MSKIQKHILVFLFTLFGVQSMNGQWILDKCFYTVSVGHDFDNSDRIANTSADGSDLIKYNGSWNGLDQNVSNNVSIPPPITCDHSKAIFMRVTSQDDFGQGVGFKLSSELETGQSLSFEFTYASHGYGSQGSFQPYIYTHSNDDFQTNGEINANYLTSLPSAGTNWETHTLSFVVNSFNDGDDWIFFYAPTSSGILFNLCQIEAGVIEYQESEAYDLCEGESIEIGEDLGEDVDYNWNNGQSSSSIEVDGVGFYTVEAQNECNTTETFYTINVHSPPTVIPMDEEILLCQGDSIILSTEGANPTNVWPDGSTDSTYTIYDEGVYDVEITDDCFSLTDQIIIEYDTIPSVDLGPDLALCEGDYYTLDATSSENEVTYLWQNGSTDSIYVVAWQDTYSVTLTNNCGSVSDEVFVEYSIDPVDVLPDTMYICSAREAVLDVSDTEGDYLWNDGSTNSILDAQYWGLYWVQIIDDDGCFYIKDSVYVKEGPCICPLYIPNAFTPDYDGLNDVLRCEFDCVPYDFVIEIYSRWGTVIHRSYDVSNCWDGTFEGGDLVPIGIYGYRIWYREQYDGIPTERTGHVTVLSDEWDGEAVQPIIGE